MTLNLPFFLPFSPFLLATEALLHDTFRTKKELWVSHRKEWTYLPHTTKSIIGQPRNQKYALHWKWQNSLCSYWQYVFLKDDIDHPMPLIRIFQRTCWLQDKVQSPQSTTQCLYSSGPAASSSLLFHYLSAIFLAVSQVNSSCSHPNSFPVPYAWNILTPIQPNFKVTFPFPESVRLCSYQNEHWLWTQIHFKIPWPPASLFISYAKKVRGGGDDNTPGRGWL